MWKLLILSTVMVTLHAEDGTLTINVKKWAHVTSDKFVSITLDPAALFSASKLETNRMRMLRLAQNLSPAYLRIAGSGTDYIKFKSYSQENFTVTDVHWIALNEFAQEAGLDLIVGLNVLQRDGNVWDLSGSLDIIALSDKLGFNVNWQLGYELQELGENIPAARFGQDMHLLRSVLSAFHRYENSLLVGPDITRFRTRQDIEFLHNYFQEAESVLDAITWHPRFNNIINGNNKSSGEVILPMESLSLTRDEVFRTLKQSLRKKPLWIAESRDFQSQGTFMDALKWIQRLGNAARIGADVVMRNPDITSLFEPTPDYWVSLVYKTLVGQSVLDAKLIHNSKSHMQLYAHCTNIMKHHTNAVSGRIHYHQGSVTIYGVNLMDKNMTVAIRAASWGKKSGEEIHEYIFTSPESIHSRKILMNGMELKMKEDGYLPLLSPNIFPADHSFTITIPPQSIGFWVVSGVQLKPCMTEVLHSGKEANRLQLPIHLKENKEMFEGTIHINTMTGQNALTETNSNINMVKSSKITMENNKHIESFAPLSSAIIPENITNMVIEDGKINISIIDENISEKSMERGTRTVPHRLKRSSEKDYGPYIIPGLNVGLYNPNQHEHKNKSHKKRRNEAEEIERERNHIHKHKKKTRGRDEIFGAPRFHATMSDPNVYDSYEDGGYNFFNNRRDHDDSFPQGDVFLRTGIDSAEDTRNRDYVYVDGPEEKRRYPDYDVEDVSNADEKEVTVDYNEKYFHGVAEFFEKGEKREVDPKLANLAELWEGDSLDFNENDLPQEDDDAGGKIIQEKPPTAEEEQKARDSALKMIESFYINSDDLHELRNSHDDHHKHDATDDNERKRKKRKKDETADNDAGNIMGLLDAEKFEEVLKNGQSKHKENNHNHQHTNHKKDKRERSNNVESNKEEVHHNNHHSETNKKEKHSKHHNYDSYEDTHKRKPKENILENNESILDITSEIEDRGKGKRKHASVLVDSEKQGKLIDERMKDKGTHTKKSKSTDILTDGIVQDSIEDEIVERYEKMKEKSNRKTQYDIVTTTEGSKIQDKKKENVLKSEDKKVISVMHSSEEYNADASDAFISLGSGMSSVYSSEEYDEIESEEIHRSGASQQVLYDSIKSKEHSDPLNKKKSKQNSVEDIIPNNVKDKIHRNNLKFRNRREIAESMNTELFTANPDDDSFSSTSLSNDITYDGQDYAEYMDDYNENSTSIEEISIGDLFNNNDEVYSQDNVSSHQDLDPLHIYNRNDFDTASHDRIMVNIAKREDATTTPISKQESENQMISHTEMDFINKNGNSQNNLEVSNLSQNKSNNTTLKTLESNSAFTILDSTDGNFKQVGSVMQNEINDFKKLKRDNNDSKTIENTVINPTTKLGETVVPNTNIKQNEDEVMFDQTVPPNPKILNYQDDVKVTEAEVLPVANALKNILEEIERNENVGGTMKNEVIKNTEKRENVIFGNESQNISETLPKQQVSNENIIANQTEEKIFKELTDSNQNIIDENLIQQLDAMTNIDRENNEISQPVQSEKEKTSNNQQSDLVLQTEGKGQYASDKLSKRESSQDVLSEISNNQNNIKDSNNNSNKEIHETDPVIRNAHTLKESNDATPNTSKPDPQDRTEALIQQAIDKLLEPLQEASDLRKELNSELVPPTTPTAPDVTTITSTTTSTTVAPPVKRITLAERRKQRLQAAKERFEKRRLRYNKGNAKEENGTKQRREALYMWDDDNFGFQGKNNLVNTNYMKSSEPAPTSDEIFMEQELLRQYVPYQTPHYIAPPQSFSDFIHNSYQNPSPSMQSHHKIVNRHISNQNMPLFPYVHNVILPQEESIFLYRNKPDIVKKYELHDPSYRAPVSEKQYPVDLNFIVEKSASHDPKNFSQPDTASITALGSGETEEFFALHLTKTTMRPLQSSQVHLMKAGMHPLHTLPHSNDHNVMIQENFHVWGHTNGNRGTGTGTNKYKYNRGNVYPKEMYEKAMTGFDNNFEGSKSGLDQPIILYEEDIDGDDWDIDNFDNTLVRQARHYSPVKLKNEIFPFDENERDIFSENLAIDNAEKQNDWMKAEKKVFLPRGYTDYIQEEDDDQILFPAFGDRFFSMDEGNGNDMFPNFESDVILDSAFHRDEGDDGVLMLVPVESNQVPRSKRSINDLRNHRDFDEKVNNPENNIIQATIVPPENNELRDDIEPEKIKEVLVKLPEKLETLWMDEELDLSRLNHNRKRVKHAEAMVKSEQLSKKNTANDKKYNTDPDSEVFNTINTDDISESEERRIRYKHKLNKYNKKLLKQEKYQNMKIESIGSIHENNQTIQENVKNNETETNVGDVTIQNNTSFDSVVNEVKIEDKKQEINDTKQLYNGNSGKESWVKVHIISYPKQRFSNSVFWRSNRRPWIKVERNHEALDTNKEEQTEKNSGSLGNIKPLNIIKETANIDYINNIPYTNIYKNTVISKNHPTEHMNIFSKLFHTARSIMASFAQRLGF